MSRSRRAITTATVWLVTALAAVAAAQTPVPRPFPGTGAPATSKPQPPPAPPAGAGTSPAPAQKAAADTPPTNVPLFPQAEFLTSFDAGRGQRYYLYGTRAPFEEVAAHYRTTLRTGGRQLYRTPAIQQFDLGRFDNDGMAYPPSVVVKDYAGEPGGGYLFVRGSAEQRFPTIIQIVPPPAGN
jgi:hypothetical protein